MKKSCFFLLFSIAVRCLAQDGITFEIEKLSKPEELLPVHSYPDICRELIAGDAGLTLWELEQDGIEFDDRIVARCEIPDSLIRFGYHSFFDGMYEAYAHHRPFVLSPDMIWLLISQGFARHVNARSEELREFFVGFSGKRTLEVQAPKEGLTNPSEWEKIFPGFLAQIAGHTGRELIHTLTADFSTTSAIEKMASQITIMEAMKPYFEYVVIYAVCGIPKVTLLGTPEDWQKVLDKTRELGKYNLSWWTDELEPILKQFVNASKGNADRSFWRNMFKYHSQKKYGSPVVIDGWIVRFFPYDKKGNRNSLDRLTGNSSLPNEIVKVDLTYIQTDGFVDDITPLELWAGFFGLEQDSATFALTPRIGWLIRKKERGGSGIFQRFERDNVPGGGFSRGIELIVSEVPEELKELDEIYSISLRFKEKVTLPDWLRKMRIGKLEIEGKLTRREKKEIASWFPETDLTIDGRDYGSGRNGWIFVRDSIPERLKGLEQIRVLEVSNYLSNEDITLPDWLKEIRISNLSLNYRASPENIERAKALLPDTKLFVNGERIK